MIERCLKILVSKSSIVYVNYANHVTNKIYCNNALFLQHNNDLICMVCGKIIVDPYIISLKCLVDDKTGEFIKQLCIT
jgi:hypothetical protein